MHYARDVSQLLAGLARRMGLNPANVPGIVQAGCVAKTDRGRAAQIAANVRSFLKSEAAQRMPSVRPRSAPGLASVGFGV